MFSFKNVTGSTINKSRVLLIEEEISGITNKCVIVLNEDIIGSLRFVVRGDSLSLSLSSLFLFPFFFPPDLLNYSRIHHRGNGKSRRMQFGEVKSGAYLTRGENGVCNP